MLAAAKGHAGVARLLLSANADLNAVDLGGKTALDEACCSGHDDLIDLLTRRSAKCALFDSSQALLSIIIPCY